MSRSPRQNGGFVVLEEYFHENCVEYGLNKQREEMK